MSDELVGSIRFSVKEILKATVQEPVCEWVNVYGAHIGYSGDNTDRMNNDPLNASCWKGRILVMYYQEEVKNPIMKVRPMTQEQITEA